MANLSALVRTTPLLLTNSSGSSAPYGSTVIIKRLTDKAFNVAPSASYAAHSIGVVLEPSGIADGAKGLVAFGGYVPKVILQSSGSQGQSLFASGQFFKAAPSDTMAAGAFGELISSGSAPEAYLFGFPVQSVGGGGGGSDLIRQPTTTLGNAIEAGFTNTVAITNEDGSTFGVGNTNQKKRGVSVGYGNVVQDSDNGIAVGIQNLAKDTNAYGKNVAMGWQNTAEGGSSMAIGYTSHAYNPFSVAVGHTAKAKAGGAAAFGYKSTAAGNYSAAFGESCYAGGNYSAAFGYHSETAFGGGPYSLPRANYSAAMGYRCVTRDAYASAFGYRADAGAPRSSVFGYKAVVSSSGSSATAIGFLAVARIERTTNICGPIIVRKDDGESSPFESFCGAEVVLFTNEVDLKAVADTAFALPAGCKLWMTEVGVICTALSGLVTQPVVRFGISGTPAKQHAAAITTKLTAAGKRDSFVPLAGEDGEVSFSAGVTIAANATSLLGRFYVKGILVESE